MAIVYDDEKNHRNIEERGLSFERAATFDWRRAVVQADRQRDYGEDRFTAVGFIDDRLHVLVFTLRGPDIRVISLRRANRREQAAYAERS
jgi:uncharacterized DUF497 family protein